MAGSSTDLVAAGPVTDAKDLATVRREKLEQLRAEKEKHTWRTIWTKDAHGGPYHKAEDVQLPGGPKRAGPVVPYAQERDEPGYERVEIGPTSNFVGDHMTQGAVELARADLVRPDRDSIARARLEGRPAPQRIAAEPGTPLETHASDIQLSRPTARVEAYRWSEAKDAVVVTFELPCGHLVDPQALSAGLGANAVLLQARCFHAGGECPAYALAIDARLGGHVLDAGQAMLSARDARVVATLKAQAPDDAVVLAEGAKDHRQPSGGGDALPDQIEGTKRLKQLRRALRSNR